MQLPRLSIITPSYNQAGFIEETIRSVLSQDYPDLEYIVMDGGSMDGTVEILKKYRGHLHWVSERDRGQSHAINKGLAIATGEVIAFINSDDVYEPGALLKVGAFFASHPQAAWLTGKCHVIDPAGVEIRRFVTWYKNFWLRFRSYRILQIMDYVSQPATFWRRSVIEKVGFFDEKLHYAMDYDYSLRVGRHFELWVLPEYLASYRIHPTSKAGASVNAQFDADLNIFKNHTSSRLLIYLHALHNQLLVLTYRALYSSNNVRLTPSA